jgi:hypothetical protein
MTSDGASSIGFGIAFSAFFVGMFVLFAVVYGVGIAALISIARTPDELFGPWWDNTKQIWILGIAVSFFVPLGSVISGIMWFTNGKGPLRHGSHIAGRPFWAGPPKPPPYIYPPPPYQPGAPYQPGPPYQPGAPYQPPGPPSDP